MKLKHTLLLCLGLAAAAPAAWAAVIERGSIGPISIDVDVSTVSTRPGQSGHADIFISNHSTTATADLKYTGMLYFSNGTHSAVDFQPRHFTLNPQEGLLTSVTFVVPPSASLGTAKLVVGVKVRAIHEGGTTTTPSEPTGAWDADTFLVN